MFFKYMKGEINYLLVVLSLFAMIQKLFLAGIEIFCTAE